MDISTQNLSKPDTTPLSPAAETAVRVAKAVAAREARSAADPGEDAASGNQVGNASESLNTALVRRAAPEVQPPMSARLELDIDPETDRVIGRIVDKETGEVLKQIPPESMLKLIEMAEMAQGAFVDEKL